jgi:LAS superfamily LD-carboxypeptidase LdcB
LRVIICLALLVAGVAHADVRVDRGYKQGKPFRIRLTTIGWAEVEVATAAAFRKMERAADRDGISLGIRSGFRSHDRQKWLYQAWREGWGNKAARPGFSNHESGRALDLYVNGDIMYWLNRNAKRFGFKQTVRGEPWHWEFTPAAAKRATARGSSKRRRS